METEKSLRLQAEHQNKILRRHNKSIETLFQMVTGAVFAAPLYAGMRALVKDETIYEAMRRDETMLFPATMVGAVLLAKGLQSMYDSYIGN